VKKKSPSILMIINVFSPDASRDNLYMSNYATIQLRDELARLDGVGDITYIGQRNYSMRVWLDPQKMAFRNLTSSDVVQTIEQQNIQVAAGQLGQPPVNTGQAFQFTITTLGRLTDADQFAEMILKTDNMGGVVRLRDVARVELGAQGYDQFCTLDKMPTVALSVYQRPGSNALKTASAVRTKMERGARLQDRLRHDAVYHRVRERGVQDAARRGHPGGLCGAVVPAELALGADSADRGSRGGHRYLRGHGRTGLLTQQPDALRTRAGDWHRGR
jgi:multidrug efflux pump subunit AcrB